MRLTKGIDLEVYLLSDEDAVLQDLELNPQFNPEGPTEVRRFYSFDSIWKHGEAPDTCTGIYSGGSSFVVKGYANDLIKMIEGQNSSKEDQRDRKKVGVWIQKGPRL